MESHNIKYERTITEAIEEINERKAEGKKVHPLTEEGLRAINVANMLVGTIMKRNKPDLGFFKIYMNSTNERITKMSGGADKKPEQDQPRVLRKKRTSDFK